jgi:WD40 repeat protein
VVALAWLTDGADGRKFLAGTQDSSQAVKLYDESAGHSPVLKVDPWQGVRSLSAHPNGTHFLTCGISGSAMVSNVRSFVFCVCTF